MQDVVVQMLLLRDVDVQMLLLQKEMMLLKESLFHKSEEGVATSLEEDEKSEKTEFSVWKQRPLHKTKKAKKVVN